MPLPLIVHLLKPRQVAQPRVVILVELRLSDVFFFHAHKLARWFAGAMLLSAFVTIGDFVTSP
jgi:hypothetical protein